LFDWMNEDTTYKAVISAAGLAFRRNKSNALSL